MTISDIIHTSITVVFLLSCMLSPGVAKSASAMEEEHWFKSELTPHTLLYDLSFLNERPAGKNGFLKVDGDRFVFANGVEPKFWGIALSGGACFPDKKDAQRLAHRLASLGFNLVRLHHMDAIWAGRGLIDYNNHSDSRHFNHENWEKLDFFIKALKDEGIYIYLDLHVSRRFREGDGISRADTLPYEGKGATLLDPRLIELQKEYAKSLWTHLNPFTGLRYYEDPVFAFTLITNENDITSHFFLTPENTDGHPGLARMFQRRLDEYAIAHGLSKKRTRKVWETAEGRQATSSMMTTYFHEMYKNIRSMGVEIPIAGTNWAHFSQDLPAMASMDFMDQHIYAEGGMHAAEFLMNPHEKATSLQRFAFARLAHRPFMVSEWSKGYPDIYRSEYPLAFAAIAAFQGWNAAVMYSYSHDSWANPYLHHQYDVIMDPARLALLPAAAVIFRLAGQKSSKHSSIKINLPDLFKGTYHPAEMLAFRSGLWRQSLDLTWDKESEGKSPMYDFLSPEAEDVRSIDGSLYWSWQQGYRLIDWPMAQAFIGKGNDEERRTTDIVFHFKSDFAAIAAVSLSPTGEPINRSHKILVTFASGAKNSGEVASSEKNGRLLSKGGPPIMFKKVSGIIKIRHNAEQLLARAIFSSGQKGEFRKLVEEEKGWWQLPLDMENNTMMYEVTVSKDY